MVIISKCHLAHGSIFKNENSANVILFLFNLFILAENPLPIGWYHLSKDEEKVMSTNCRKKYYVGSPNTLKNQSFLYSERIPCLYCILFTRTSLRGRGQMFLLDFLGFNMSAVGAI